MLGIPESHQDLLGADVATLGTIGPDGRPQLSVVWFMIEGEDVKISLNATRQKVKNLRRHPGCSLLILDLANAGRYLELRGDARIDPDDDYAFADQVGARYGVDVRTRDRPGESRVVVSFRPDRARAWG